MHFSSFYKITLGLSVAATAMAADAEPKIGFEPAFGVEKTATVGSSVLVRYSFDAIRVAKAATVIEKRVIFPIRIEAGEPLYPTSSATAKFKACVNLGACGFDDDGDGNFDRIAKDFASAAFKLNAPVPYEIKEITNPDKDSFRQVVSYMGATRDALRLSYREFINGTARPAFTEEMTLPLGTSFPQMVAFKDVKLTILGIDGMGLRYRVEK